MVRQILRLCAAILAQASMILAVGGLVATPAMADVQGEIVFRDVSFAYPERGAVLQGVDLTLPAGKTTAVVGSTGSGKSTLVKLLLRFLESDHGSILLDGQEVRELSRRSLRRCFSLVSQDVFLSDDTVRHNIAYGSPDGDDEKLLEAARVAEAEEFVLSLPQGLDARLGERAQQLSGGQRQRLAIARAVFRNAPILILDEATSAVDNETEAALARSLRRVCSGRTTLIIAHRLSSVRQADCIHVLESGRIVESGTHEQLLEKSGVYARLWDIQTGARV